MNAKDGGAAGRFAARRHTAYDDEAIRSEADLLAFDPEALSWLTEQLGPDYVHRWRPQISPEEVAGWMHTLRLKLADWHSRSGV